MTIEVGWGIDHADGTFGGDRMSLRTAADVEEFVRRLGGDGAGVAWVNHKGRSLWNAELGIPDHEVFAAVYAGFGYFSYQDPTVDKCYPVGLPDSPEVEYDDDDFPPGSGVSTTLLTRAVAEFLATKARPTCLDWTS
ncbi:Imm1 family immunity protein [Actinokineospora auranticolor]|uniref:Immunity protein Imm1 of predicted polymorphic toxin system n=1 Tax=Actinokineospora auranticolor TaxID=155976 RepID=A0A2S6GYL7_9PSEU|nr:Imm1 family immunity protein [Actinokineospora auranticolor]PPK70324.1 immunity protein Imm1 of predicted polymorphic toxin system [Actinokineospora auranticolor]